jgi:hypothetical protein
VALIVLLLARAASDHRRFRADVRTPAALTSVVGPAVLGTRLTVLGWDWAGVALLVIALVLWAALLAPVLAHWRTPTVGASLLLAVSTESLAVLAATLAIPEHAHGPPSRDAAPDSVSATAGQPDAVGHRLGLRRRRVGYS